MYSSVDFNFPFTAAVFIYCNPFACFIRSYTLANQFHSSLFMTSARLLRVLWHVLCCFLYIINDLTCHDDLIRKLTAACFYLILPASVAWYHSPIVTIISMSSIRVGCGGCSAVVTSLLIIIKMI